jgi:hypothetical protein
MSAIADKPFRIVDYLPQVRVNSPYGEAWVIDQANTDGNYEVLYATPTNGAWLYRSQIDISGWTKEGLTAFFAGLYLQRPLPYSSNYTVDPNLGGAVIQDIVIVTDVPINNPLANTALSAGFPDDPSDYMTVKLGTGSQRVQTISAPSNLVENDSWNYGSADPTASDTLYVYRYVIVSVPQPIPLLDAVILFPCLRLVAEGIATQEPEYVYLTRLRRSYELRENG